MPTAIVTGAAGFIGSHLCDRLLKDGWVVYGLDMAPHEHHNLDVARDHPSFRYFEIDLSHKLAVERWFDRVRADVCFHLASVVGVPRYMADPLGVIDTNINGTRLMAELCMEHDVRLCFTSTSEIYGRNEAVPWAEDADRVLGPTHVSRWTYSASKALCEAMLFALAPKGLKMSIVRFFNVYGPRQNPIYLVSGPTYKVLRGERPEVHDGGFQTRSLTYIADAIEGLIRAATYDTAMGEVFNIGNEHEFTVREVVNAVLWAADSTLAPLKVDMKERHGREYEDIGRRVPDASKARALLKWTANTHMTYGIKATVEWARQNPWYLEDFNGR